MATVADHLAVLRRLLHDPDDRYWPEADKIAYISEAVKRRDLLTGQNRVLLSVNLVAGTNSYSMTTAGNARVFDVIGIQLTFGGVTMVLDNLSYTDLAAQWLSFTSTYRDIPRAWARHGASNVIFGPIPGIAYATVWDCSTYSADLDSTDDSDPLPYPYTEPVPFYAAALAKFNERQYDEAADFEAKFIEAVNIAGGARVGSVPTMYPAR